VLLPFSYYFPVSLGRSRMNLTNLLLLLLLVRVCSSGVGILRTSAVKGFLGAPMCFLFAFLIVGFVSAQWHDLSHVDNDLASLKNAIIFPRSISSIDTVARTCVAPGN
jgi:hypothetical protein